jgi:hypothetical protein
LPRLPAYLPRLRYGLRVSPCPASSGFTGDGPLRRLKVRILRRCRLIVSGLPRTAILRYRRRSVCGFPRNLHLPAPADDFPRLPRFPHPPASPERILGSPRIFFGLWLLRLTSFQIALALWSFGGAQDPLSGSPRIAVLKRCRLCSLGLPRVCFPRLGR